MNFYEDKIVCREEPEMRFSRCVLDIYVLRYSKMLCWQMG